MLKFIEFLEEIERNGQTVVIEGADVERLVERFGSQVRSMGLWNKTTDGSVEVPMANIIAAAEELGDRSLTEAVEQLKTPVELTGILNRSAAAEQLIETLARIHLQQFRRQVEGYQDSSDPSAVDRLRGHISKELFGA